MPVTLEQLAKVAGVSVSTASRALNKSKHTVNEETRNRILTLAKQLDYRPNMVARSLKTERTHTIGIIIDDIASPFGPVITRGIQDYLKEYGYFSVLINGDWNPEVEIQAVHDLISRSIDGIIFVESWLREANPTLDLANKPYVFVHRLFGGVHHNSVGVDEHYGAKLAIQHLAKLGHHRIAYINGPRGWYAAEQRLIGYRETLSEYGLPFDPELVLEGNWEIQSAYPAARRFLELKKRPTAIFAANDLMALGAIYAIQEAGLRVPEDIAVVGYDDREIASLSQPTLTTVRLPCYEMGQASAKLLLSLLEKGRESPNAPKSSDVPASPEPIKIQGQLIVRESCGAEEGKILSDKYHSHAQPRRQLMNRRRP
jgi:LacI family transcriptional regulator